MNNQYRKGSIAYFVSLTLAAAASMTVAPAANAGTPPFASPAKPGMVCLDVGLDGMPLALADCPAGRTLGTYYANSDILEKFIDELPVLMDPTTAPAGAKFIPTAVADTTTYPGSDYYVMGVVEYSQRMHTDLPKATTLRGYVQLYPKGTPPAAYSANANAYPLTYPDGSKIFWPGTQEQVVALGQPHYLGPVVVATKDKPVRVLMMNLLPAGRHDGVNRNGDLPLPVDEALGGAGATPDHASTFGHNRVAIHLHGGDSPWISDGTPHQWFLPGNDTTTTFTKGESLRQVPDMPDPGPGGTTLYWPNNQSARFMWFHDHTFGLTRQNAYIGMATGYLITDPAQDQALGISQLETLPLILQDKTFVPSDVATQDAKWDLARWGQPGDLWMPHVYEKAEVDVGNGFEANPAGRWDFAPADPAYAGPMPLLNVPEVSTTPEMFNDTPVINGVAYPTITVQPKAYRVRMLNGSNDRYLNLSLFKADPAFAPGTQGYGTEVRMVAEPKLASILLDAPGAGYSDAPTVTISAPPAVAGARQALASAVVNLDGTLAEIRVTDMGHGYDPASPPTVTITDATGSGAAASAIIGRAEGIPDPTLAGPAFVHFGTEAGLLPAPVVRTAGPLEINDYGEAVQGGLFMATAERADTIVDFSQYAGETLILYNDSVSPVPGGDTRYDYFTGDPDQLPFGGAPSTQPGFGPNVRTLMQIKVAAAAPAPAFDVQTFATNIATHHTVGIDPLIEGTNPDVGAMSVSLVDGQNTLTIGGRTVPLQVKTIEGTYDVNFGRLIANFGTELPGGSSLAPTLLGYIDPPTEILNPGETQYWILKNHDADNHPIHFHLFNVQVLARHIGNGVLKAPRPEEMGWKETVQSWPGEDVIVAMQPKTPLLPFGLANSKRLLDPSLAAGTQTPHLDYTSTLTGATAPFAFQQVDFNTGAPANVSNVEQDFGWEYVWHCHILGHEENDLMRPMVFNAVTTQPGVPVISGVTLDPVSGQPVVSWSDPSSAATIGDSSAEYGFRVERAMLTDGIAGSFLPLPTTALFHGPGVNTLANATAMTDTQGWTANTDYQYRVVAVNQASSSSTGATASGIFTVASLPSTPLNLAAAPSVDNVAQTASIALSWTDSATNETGYEVRENVGGVVTVLTTLPAGSTSHTIALGSLSVAVAKTYEVVATNGQGASAAATVTVTPPLAIPAAPSAVTAIANRNALTGEVTVDLAWTDNALVEAGYEILRNGVVMATLGADSNTYHQVLSGLNSQVTYTYTIRALNAAGNGDATVQVTTPAVPPATPAALTATTTANTKTGALTVKLAWTDGANETGYRIKRNGVQIAQLGANVVAFSEILAKPLADTSYSYEVTAYNAGAESAPAAVTVKHAIAAPLAPTGVAANLTRVPATNTATVQLTWNDVATNEASYTVSKAGKVIATLPAGTTSFTDTLANLTSATAIKATAYVVAAVNNVGTAAAAALSVTPGVTLAAPSTLRASYAGGAKPTIILNWADQSFAESGYVVQRSSYTANPTTGVLAWTAFANLPGATSKLATNLLTYTDTTVTGSSLHQYKVFAINGATNGPAASLTLDTGAPLAAPTALKASGTATTTSLGLGWTKTPSAYATGYELEVCVGTAAACALGTAVWTPVATLPGSATVKYTHAGRTSRTSYTYRLRAVTSFDPALASPWSNVVTLTTK